MKKILLILASNLLLTLGPQLSLGQDNAMSFFLASGHHDRLSRGELGSPWDYAHATRGCSQELLRASGGDGLFYCVVAD